MLSWNYSVQNHSIQWGFYTSADWQGVCACVNQNLLWVNCCTDNGKWVQLHVAWHLVMKGNAEVKSPRKTGGKTVHWDRKIFYISCSDFLLLLTNAGYTSFCPPQLEGCMPGSPVWLGVMRRFFLAHMLWLQKSWTMSCPKIIRKMSLG